ncbi:MAG: DUF3040 domain-containing protein [Sporichthyaceae bacterium]
MKGRDHERRALNAIESDLWTSDPEFYRQFDQGWSHGRFHQAERSRLWLLPVTMVVSGFLLYVIFISSR